MTATAINTLAQDELCSLQTQLRARLRVSACLCRGLYAGCLRAGVSGLLTLKKLTRELRRERQAPSESTRRLPRTSAAGTRTVCKCCRPLAVFSFFRFHLQYLGCKALASGESGQVRHRWGGGQLTLSAVHVLATSTLWTVCACVWMCCTLLR